MSVEDLPEFLSFVEDGLNTIFNKIHYKNLQFSKSYFPVALEYKWEILAFLKSFSLEGFSFTIDGFYNINEVSTTLINP
ncbi:hypothetical protein Q765_20870 [Flavobacterium rivuli WB 3.3-2 = DSM 21788]|uniref:Uncharacterized protein n=1 Tax=Flavobacterium rivuli WB 3.3-2 = DSM 21788 TaxID=1121895 RepID=A0A0A2LZ01_9FLAO|nr:hypothetical protein [Flavobacterium rivuli]KGO84571.1 hypothetical protein Q765_20870 [Flavobacterium rivuli WB 3.3-2 = DSM 21788]